MHDEAQFDPYQPDQDVFDIASEVIRGDNIEPANVTFYIGGTQNPADRWLHATWGHVKRFDSMTIIGMRPGSSAGRLEQALIRHFKFRHPDNCDNKALDNRGLCRQAAVQFLYVCIKD